MCRVDTDSEHRPCENIRDIPTTCTTVVYHSTTSTVYRVHCFSEEPWNTHVERERERKGRVVYGGVEPYHPQSRWMISLPQPSPEAVPATADSDNPIHPVNPIRSLPSSMSILGPRHEPCTQVKVRVDACSSVRESRCTRYVQCTMVVLSWLMMMDETS